jgi:uncharacterized protein DUF6777
MADEPTSPISTPPDRPTGLDSLEWPTRRKVRVLLGGVVVLAVLAVAIYGIPALFSGPSTAPTSSANQIIEEPASVPGPNPFTRDASAPNNPPIIGAALPANQPTTDSADTQTTSGDAMALYAGTLGDPGAHPARLIMDLQGDPAKAGAWARVADTSTANIGRYVSALTPVLLRQDTRVTDFSWQDGQAVAHQAVLQAGTSVLVDNRGQPRVRTVSGSPLADPIAVAGAPHYTGPGWIGFSPSGVDTVLPAAQPVTAFVLFDPATRLSFARPVATLGTADLLIAPAAPPPGAPGAVPALGSPTLPGPLTMAADSAPGESSDSDSDSDDWDDSDGWDGWGGWLHSGDGDHDGQHRHHRDWWHRGGHGGPGVPGSNDPVPGVPGGDGPGKPGGDKPGTGAPGSGGPGSGGPGSGGPGSGQAEGGHGTAEPTRRPGSAGGTRSGSAGRDDSESGGARPGSGQDGSGRGGSSTHVDSADRAGPSDHGGSDDSDSSRGSGDHGGSSGHGGSGSDGGSGDHGGSGGGHNSGGGHGSGGH